jgi:transcriptional regulator with XRE-family HTH domain
MDNILAPMAFNTGQLNPNLMASKIAENMTSLRLWKNITQHELAKRSGVSLGSLKRFERNHEISLKHLLQLAVVLDVLDQFDVIFQNQQAKTFDQLVSTKSRKRARNV